MNLTRYQRFTCHVLRKNLTSELDKNASRCRGRPPTSTDDGAGCIPLCFFIIFFIFYIGGYVFDRVFLGYILLSFHLRLLEWAYWSF